MEFWLTVRDHPNYEVSNLGKVRNKRTGKYLKPQLNRPNGYHRVYMDGDRHYVHRVVANTFFDSENTSKLDVNHIDGDRTNNQLSNLEWCTRKENVNHAYINGLKYPTVLKVVRCGFCKNRYEFDFCYDKDDSFYCSYGER